MNTRPLACAQHVERATHHVLVGNALHEEINEEWAGVCYFYSAYHLVKAALTTDPIFDDLTALKKIDPNLMETDRWADKHHVPSKASGFGINNLVKLIYPETQGSYHELHGASVGVRYGLGVTVPLNDLAADLRDVRATLEVHPRLPVLGEELAARSPR